MNSRKPFAIVCIGAPGSGKSRFARRLVETGAVQIERDRFREELAGSRSEFYTKFTRHIGEAAVSHLVRQSLIECAKSKKTVIISDTNINKRLRHRLYSDLFDLGYQIHVEVFDEPLDVLLERNESRPDDEKVPVHVIEKMVQDFTITRDMIENEVAVLNFRYCPLVRHETPTRVFDIDGTVAEHSVEGRSPFLWDRVGEDLPRWNVIEQIDRDSYSTVFMSGRDSVCRTLTEDWLRRWCEYRPDTDQLIMRAERNTDPDWIVKGLMMIKFLKDNPKTRIATVFDDRQSVVNIWSNMGLEVWQVQQSKF